MTSIDFLNKVHKILDSQEYNLSYSPAKSKNYMLYCKHRLTRAHREKQLKMSCQALHNAPPNRT